MYSGGGDLVLCGDENGKGKISLKENDESSNSSYIYIKDDVLNIENENNINFNTKTSKNKLTYNGIDIAKVDFSNVPKDSLNKLLKAVGSTGDYEKLNIVIGENVLPLKGLIYPSGNVAIGYDIMNNVKNPSSTICIGRDILKTTENTWNTIVIGNGSLKNSTFDSTTGGNTAIGNDISPNAVNCEMNVAIGNRSLKKNTLGSNNTSIGYSSLLNNTTGNYNTSVGLLALMNNTTGNYNTAIGYGALANKNSYSECTAIGNLSDVTGSNQVQLGSSSETVYAQKAIATRSDRRDKVDINDSNLGLNFITKLRPVSYRMNPRESYFNANIENDNNIECVDYSLTNDGSRARKRPHYGFIAQEVKEVMNELDIDFAGYLDASYDGGEDVLSLSYTEFIGPMVKAIQEQQEMINELKTKIDDLTLHIN